MKLIGDSIMQYPAAQLHFNPNFWESTGYLLTTPITRSKTEGVEKVLGRMRCSVTTRSATEGAVDDFVV